MAKNAQGYMGTQIGKLGTAVGRRFRGIQVYSAYQPFVRNPKSAGQKKQRAIFSQIIAMGLAMRKGLELGMQSYIKGTTRDARSAFFHLNYRAVSVTSGGEISTNYGDLRVAKGTLEEVSFGNPDFDTAAQVTVPFSTIMADANENDLVYLVVYQPDTQKCVVSDGVKRSNEHVTCDVPAVWSGLRVHVYGFAVAEDDPDNPAQGAVSNSAYIGQGDIN